MTPILLTNRFVSAFTEKNEAITLSIDCYEVGGMEIKCHVHHVFDL